MYGFITFKFGLYIIKYWFYCKSRRFLQKQFWKWKHQVKIIISELPLTSALVLNSSWLWSRCPMLIREWKLRHSNQAKWYFLHIRLKMLIWAFRVICHRFYLFSEREGLNACKTFFLSSDFWVIKMCFVGDLRANLWGLNHQTYIRKPHLLNTGKFYQIPCKNVGTYGKKLISERNQFKP